MIDAGMGEILGRLRVGSLTSSLCWVWKSVVIMLVDMSASRVLPLYPPGRIASPFANAWLCCVGRLGPSLTKLACLLVGTSGVQGPGRFRVARPRFAVRCALGVGPVKPLFPRSALKPNERGSNEVVESVALLCGPCSFRKAFLERYGCISVFVRSSTLICRKLRPGGHF